MYVIDIKTIVFKTLCKNHNITIVNKIFNYLPVPTANYRIDANTTADSIITAPRVNLNTKAPKYLNLNNITAS